MSLALDSKARIGGRIAGPENVGQRCACLSIQLMQRFLPVGKIIWEAVKLSELVPARRQI